MASSDDLHDPSALPSSFDASFREEKPLSKLWRKFHQEPLIPLGCALTCYALYQASRSMRSGDHNRTNRMFRARIYAQAFTIAAMVAGSYYYADERGKRKELEGALAERRAKEKQEAWIRELEHRAREEEEIARQMEAVREARRGGGAPPASAAPAPFEQNKSVLEESERRWTCRGRPGAVMDAILELKPEWR